MNRHRQEPGPLLGRLLGDFTAASHGLIGPADNRGRTQAGRDQDIQRFDAESRCSEENIRKESWLRTPRGPASSSCARPGSASAWKCGR